MEEGTAGRSPSCRHCLFRPPSTSIHVRRPRLVGRKCQCSPPWDFRLPKYGERRPCTSGRCYFPFEIRGTDMHGVSPKHSGSAQCLCACVPVPACAPGKHAIWETWLSMAAWAGPYFGLAVTFELPLRHCQGWSFAGRARDPMGGFPSLPGC